MDLYEMATFFALWGWGLGVCGNQWFRYYSANPNTEFPCMFYLWKATYSYTPWTCVQELTWREKVKMAVECSLLNVRYRSKAGACGRGDIRKLQSPLSESESSVVYVNPLTLKLISNYTHRLNKQHLCSNILQQVYILLYTPNMKSNYR